MKVFILQSGGVSLGKPRGPVRLVLDVEDAPSRVTVDVEALRAARQHKLTLSPPRQRRARKAAKS